MNVNDVSVRPGPCPGPLVWFEVEAFPRPCGHEHEAAVLECSSCGYVVTTSNFHDGSHRDTELLRGT